LDDPLRFDPDRFDQQRSKVRDRWQYFPLGGGPRSCIGDHFSMFGAALALATIIRRVEIHSAAGDFPAVMPPTAVATPLIRA
jgi:cytochrome P450